MSADNIDPGNAMLLQLFEARTREQQAQQQLELAKLKSAHLGRTAIPTVFAQRQQQAEKLAKQREKNEQSAKEGQARAQAGQVMPMTDVTGMPRTGTGAGIASDLLKATLGGGGIRRQGLVPSGGTQPGQVAGPGAAPGQPAAPVYPAAGQAPPGAAAAPPTATPPAPAAPGAISVTPTGVPGIAQARETLTGGQRAVSAGAALLDFIARRGEAITGVKEAWSGERDLGTLKVPTAQEIAAPHVQDLAELEALRTRSTDPATKAAAETAFQDRLTQIRTQATQYGADPDQAAESAVGEATTVLLTIDRKHQEKLAAEERAFEESQREAQLAQRRKRDDMVFGSGLRLGEAKVTAGIQAGLEIAREERLRATPEGQVKETQAVLTQKYLAGGRNALTPQEFRTLPANIVAAETQAARPQMSPNARSNLEKVIENARKNQQNAAQLEAVFEPGYYSDLAGPTVWMTKKQSRWAEAGVTGVAPSQDALDFADRYSLHDQALGNLRSDKIRSEAGMQISPGEWALVGPTIPDKGDSKQTAAVKLPHFREYMGLSALRATLALEVGYGTTLPMNADNTPVWSFAQVRDMVPQFVQREVARLQLEDPNLDPIQAEDQVRARLWGEYGLRVGDGGMLLPLAPMPQPGGPQ